MRSIVASVVPVFSAAGRRVPAAFVSFRALQKGFWLGSVLPARMFVTTYAACGLTTLVFLAFAPSTGQMTLPDGSVILRIVVRGIRTPPFAMAPYAPTRSIMWISVVPMPTERPGSTPGWNLIPNLRAVCRTWSTPLYAAALIDGMFSETWSASRRRSGPRSIRSASVGVQPPPKSVTTSMNIDAAVSVPSWIPVM